MRERGREQHDHQRLIQTSLTATLQMDSIVVAALIAVILVQAELPAFERSAGVLAISAMTLVLASACCATLGAFSRTLRVLPEPHHSRAAAASMSRSKYLNWSSIERERAAAENDARLAQRGALATLAQVFAYLAAVVAAAAVVGVIVS